MAPSSKTATRRLQLTSHVASHALPSRPGAAADFWLVADGEVTGMLPADEVAKTLDLFITAAQVPGTPRAGFKERAVAARSGERR
jgi:hypothetical protein